MVHVYGPPTCRPEVQLFTNKFTLNVWFVLPASPQYALPVAPLDMHSSPTSSLLHKYGEPSIFTTAILAANSITKKNTLITQENYNSGGNKVLKTVQWKKILANNDDNVFLITTFTDFSQKKKKKCLPSQTTCSYTAHVQGTSKK